MRRPGREHDKAKATDYATIMNSGSKVKRTNEVHEQLQPTVDYVEPAGDIDYSKYVRNKQ